MRKEGTKNGKKKKKSSEIGIWMSERGERLWGY